MRHSTLIKLTLAALSLNALPAFAQNAPPATQPAESQEQRDARMAWWREARFGMFIHWGIYSVPAGFYDGKPVQGIGEWIMLRGQIPVARYAEYAKEFDASKFDADAIAKLAKDAGMKYIVITSKHHDGFAMFHTAVDGYNVYDATPFHRDPLKELAEACKKQGIKLGFYYSQCQDWHHPGGAAARGGHWDKAQDGDFAEYVHNVALPQVRELLTNYGDVSVLWFDTPLKEMTPELAKPFVDLLHELRPNIIWNNRLGGGYKGDTETPEQFVPPTGFPGRDWESCMTINGTWGYKSDDQNFKSTSDLLRHLVDAASKGGNYLLNIGPDSHGVVPQPEVDRLQEIGKWLDQNGEAVYGTTASPFKQPLPFGYATQKPARLFVTVFDRPNDGTIWLPISSPIKQVALLGEPQRTLQVTPKAGGIEIQLPSQESKTLATVLTLTYDGSLTTFRPPVTAAADGSIELNSSNAELSGGASITMGRPTDANGVAVVMKAPGDQAKWMVEISQAGEYQLSADLGSGGESLPLTVRVGAQTQTIRSKPTTAPSAHETVQGPQIHLNAGTNEILADFEGQDAKGIYVHSVSLSRH